MQLSITEVKSSNCDVDLIVVGYANEVGESFRALIHVNWVRFSYVVSSSYVCADAASKGSDVAEVYSEMFYSRIKTFLTM